MTNPIAIVGAACRYPDAASPSELWENVLAKRQAFRRMPPERLPLDDYYSADPNAPDRTYSQNAALITDWTFDRAKYRVSRSTYDSADLAHWLALEVADAALQDAGFDPPADMTGVILGNTLTGDSSRANGLRLRWPYVRRAAIEAGATPQLLERLEQEFNGPLAAVGEDTLSGGLSNTIAGRICNYFGFNGGGYTVDGACSSSLLSIIHACNALNAGDLDVALAGGVDLSLDPFELIGFAKVTALAKERMWVFDKKANGFLPGEGCGFVVLMRREDAIRDGRRIYASLLGWGMSSDGHGGMTRPEASGQRMAFRRAYAKAGIPIDSVTLFEGHGTGTPVGDPIEISTVTSLLESADAHPHFIGSIKANIGHTKAAAGIAGLLKSMMAVHHGVIPPITGCNEPRDVAPLQVAQSAIPWPENAPRRAAVSAMGFGGINTHVILEGESKRVDIRTIRTPESELFLFGANTREELRATLAAVASRAADLSLAELSDLSAALRERITGRAFRAAFAAGTPKELRSAALSAIEDASVVPQSSDPTLDAIAAEWNAGADVDLDALFADRFTRPFDLDKRPSFIVSPTERLRERPAATDVQLLARIAEEEPAAAVPTPRMPQPVEGSLRELVAKHVDLSLDLVLPTSKLLSDLHLSSITVARLLADAARSMGVPPLADPTSFANATIEEATEALEALRGVEALAAEPRLPDGVANWVRAFTIEDVPVRGGARAKRTADSQWQLLGEWPEARERFRTVPGRGIVAVLPKDDASACIDLLLRCRALGANERLVVVQQAPCGSGFARTLFIEKPNVSVRIVNVPRLDAGALANVVTEAEAHGDFCEATYGEDGVRREPRVTVANIAKSEAAPLGADDVLLVTGGGKGIGFESAFHLAKESGARLILLGRSKDDDELRTNFQRLTAAKIRFDYVVADVTKPLPRFDGVTAILHAAGFNAPALLDALDETSFRAAVTPKLDGLRNVLAAVDASSLKLLITLGSVIARTGMRGEAHYAFANEWLARATGEFGAEHPSCRAICIEWSVWSGMGMGERLGTMDALRRQGITPIAPDEAVRLTMQLAAAPPASHVMACGRLGDPPTIRFADDPPPLYRFLEQPRVVVPGVELVCDSEISLRNDPYLADHAFSGEPLVPAVVGLEAMAQAALMLSGQAPSRIDNVELLQPVTLATMRVAALQTGDRIDVAVRTSSTQFRLDHFRARLTVGPPPKRPRIKLPAGTVDLDPARDLYGPLLFHTGRFRGVKRYRVLTATHCVAEIAPHADSLFHRYLPAQLLLGDATIRDAAIHALQACVPQATVLPQGIASVELFAPVEGETVVVAHETSRHADGFVYDVDLAAPDGRLFERWRGLRLQIVARRERVDDLAPALWAPFLERELDVRVRVGNGESPVLHRHDGKPLAAHGHISRSHDSEVTLTVTHEKPVGVDVQKVLRHASLQHWDDIIGPHDRGLADVCVRLSGDDRRYAAARVWSARESMKKLAGDALVPLVIDTCGTHGRVTFRSGPHRIDTYLMRDSIVAVAKERTE